MTSVLSRIVLSIIALLGGMSPALAACQLIGVQSVVPSALHVGTYTASLLPPPVTVTVNVTMLVDGHGGGCKGEYGLVRASAPARMTRMPAAPVTLPYNVTSNGSPILSFGASATVRQRMPNINVRNGQTTTTVALAFTILPLAPTGVPLAGSYADPLTLHVFDVQGSRSTPIGQAPLTVSAQVVNSCYLAAPGALNMNFTADVATGIPQGAPQTIVFNVNCTGPARMQLSGSALTAPVPASGVFDNLINYRASATFAGTSATLTTSGTSSASVVSASMSAAAGTNMPVSVNVNLLPGRPLIGSTTYSGVLRVIVDPAM